MLCFGSSESCPSCQKGKTKSLLKKNFLKGAIQTTVSHKTKYATSQSKAVLDKIHLWPLKVKSMIKIQLVPKKPSLGIFIIVDTGIDPHLNIDLLSKTKTQNNPTVFN